MTNCHPTDYFAARAAFLNSCENHAIPVKSYVCPTKGPSGQLLTTDVARLGPISAEKTLFIISGTHGLEGLAGSYCQVAWIKQAGQGKLPGNTALVFIHMLNPWGCAWQRRQNEDNIDLNRNFLDFTAPIPLNPNYDILRDSLHLPGDSVPALFPGTCQINKLREQMGERNFATALFQGQYSDAIGVGFGGHAESWSNRTLRTILEGHATGARISGLIDLHTGLGPFGKGMLIATDPRQGIGTSMALNWYGPSLIILQDRPEELPYKIDGDICSAAQKILPRSTVVAVALEFGTYEVDRLLSLQIDDCRLMNHGDVNSPEGRKIRASLQDFFYPDDQTWRSMIAARFNEIMEQSLAGLRKA